MVSPMSSRPLIRQCLRNGSISNLTLPPSGPRISWFGRSMVSVALAPRSASSNSLSRSSWRDADRQDAVLEAVVVEDVAERGRDHAADAEIEQRPGRVLAARAAAEIVAGDQHLGVAIGRLVEDEIRILAAVVLVALLGEQPLAKAGALDGLEVLLRDDHVGVDIDDLQRRRDAFQRGELVHRSRFSAKDGRREPVFIANRAGNKGRIGAQISYCANRASAQSALGLDRGHIVVGEPEMMADLVDQDVADDMAQRSPHARPNSPGSAGGRARPCWAGARRRHGSAAAGRCPGTGRAGRTRSRLHLVQHLLGREVVDADDHALAELAKRRRQALEHVMRHGFHLGQRRGFQVCPHGLLIARVPRRCIRLYKRGEVDGRRQNGERRASKWTVQVGGKMRAKTALTLLCMGLFSQFCVGAEAPDRGPRDQARPRRPRQTISRRRASGPRRACASRPITVRMASIPATIPVPMRCASATPPMCRNIARAAR